MNFIKSRLGECLVLLSALSWGCISIFTVPLKEDLHFSSAQIVAVRAIITTVISGLVILFKDPNLFKVKIRDLWIFFGTGIMSFLFFNVCYMSSIVENSPSVACILMYTSIIWVTVLSVPLYREKLTSNKIIAIILCFGGCIMTCMSDDFVLTKWGLVLGLCSGLGYALYSLFGKVAVKQYDALTVLFYSFLFASLGAIPLSDLPELIPLVSQPRGIELCLGIAIMCTAFSYFVYTLGMSEIGPSKASIIAGFEPAVATIVGLVVFDKNPGIIGILGIVTVISSIIYLEIGKPIVIKHKVKQY